MSGRRDRSIRTAILAVALVTALPVSAARAEPVEPPGSARPTDATGPARSGSGTAESTDERSVAELLVELRKVYQEAEEATEKYNATEEKLKDQQAEAERLNRDLARARVTLHHSRGAAGRLARLQYQNRSADISTYVQLLLADDPQAVLEQGRVLQRAALGHASTVARLERGEKTADAVATRARRALDNQQRLAAERKTRRDAVHERLRKVEELLVSLTPRQIEALRALEVEKTEKAQEELIASGALAAPGAPEALGKDRTPSEGGARAVRYAVEQIGKPYEWAAEGPDAFDSSGLTQQAWAAAVRGIPRTSQEQWARLPKVPLNELRPGDLVVYFPKATHVALYLGDGLVVEAPRPGTRVKVSPLASYPLLGAVRPDEDAEPLDPSAYGPPELPEGALTYGSSLPPWTGGVRPGVQA
jgi:cell wall-associated NlpC family hydrolase